MFWKSFTAVCFSTALVLGLIMPVAGIGVFIAFSAAVGLTLVGAIGMACTGDCGGDRVSDDVPCHSSRTNIVLVPQPPVRYGFWHNFWHGNWHFGGHGVSRPVINNPSHRPVTRNVGPVPTPGSNGHGGMNFGGRGFGNGPTPKLGPNGNGFMRKGGGGRF